MFNISRIWLRTCGLQTTRVFGALCSAPLTECVCLQSSLRRVIYTKPCFTYKKKLSHQGSTWHHFSENTENTRAPNWFECVNVWPKVYYTIILPQVWGYLLRGGKSVANNLWRLCVLSVRYDISSLAQFRVCSWCVFLHKYYANTSFDYISFTLQIQRLN